MTDSASNGRRRNGSPKLRRRSRPGRARSRWLHPSIALLGLGCVLLAAVAYQAHAAVRSHRATVDRLLADYARAAAWNYRQRTEPELRAVLEHLLHPLHDVAPDRVRRHAPPLRDVLHASHAGEPAACGDVGEIAEAVRYSLRSGELEVAGSVSPEDAARLAEAVATQARRGAFVHRTDGVLGVELADGPVVAAYSRQRVARDTLVYALILGPPTLAGMLGRAVDQGWLLPEPLVAALPTERLLALRVGVPGGGDLFRSSDRFPDEYTASEPLGGSEGHLQASVGLWSGAAEHLAIGGLPRARLPILLALLGLAAGLLVVAFVQLRREHELAAMRADFVSSVSHELRTPLALQRVFLDTLRLGRAGSDDRRAWALENIDRETHRLTHLVENVLRFARAGEGRPELDPTPTDLGREVAEIVEEHRPLAEDATIAFEPPGARIVVPVDREGLRQVLRNLVENAVKYGPRGQVVEVGLRLANDRVVLTVDDEGPGIPPDERRRIWEPFERGEAAARGARGGSGIGLSVVREIVERHGGSVAVEEAPAGGARFRIELPDARREPAGTTAADPGAGPAAARTGPAAARTGPAAAGAAPAGDTAALADG